MTTPPFDCMIGFPGFVGFPQTPDEDFQLDSTTVDELDLLRSAEELLAMASSQAKRRGLKVKRLREKLWAERAQARKEKCSLEQRLAKYTTAGTALSELYEQLDRAEGAARSLGFDLAKAQTIIRRQQAALRRRRPKAVKRVQLPDGECCVCLDKQSTHAFVPCGHLCVCSSCAELLMRVDAKCPYCRARAMETCQIRFT
ncbi:Zinc finger, C3HC4 type (RING finger) domain-containing protein [Giardia duodenalis]|uniref:Zinc finger, C3HC4 type (RING finger) domain-containing protein n=1 Tax=Giardia intestinalis (strain ATCC 50803 / WB clone C6) TaxID=184922 RepID=A8BF50_GIAIC|nr:Zinc finger, C3HC4 type (RING finger) domain-containing protein [Giardia intestinalis]KAE8305699.1 Zinc finger, C3HC4 type (RING finger) domain-containing protein [Giardia intestinalis]|eukprot:XP_001707481.1 Ribonuclease [Giardia lamblia ATCC 50803]